MVYKQSETVRTKKKQKTSDYERIPQDFLNVGLEQVEGGSSSAEAEAIISHEGIIFPVFLMIMNHPTDNLSVEVTEDQDIIQTPNTVGAWYLAGKPSEFLVLLSCDVKTDDKRTHYRCCQEDRNIKIHK